MQDDQNWPIQFIILHFHNTNALSANLFGNLRLFNATLMHFSVSKLDELIIIKTLVM